MIFVSMRVWMEAFEIRLSRWEARKNSNAVVSGDDFFVRQPRGTLLVLHVAPPEMRQHYCWSVISIRWCLFVVVLSRWV